ncbi:MAG: hypothetical protein PHY71_02195 [Bacteroidaceae bacterium]|nr:hypothetical protein [Bacteroidaceae bacterium]
MRKTGIASTNSVQVVIPKACGDIVLSDGDFIIKGVCPIMEPKSSKDIVNGHLVTSADYKDYGADMSHWEVLAK